MRINIVDNKIKYALNLTSEELVHLMRLQPLQNRRTPFQIVSPVLLVCGDEKHEVEVKQVNESGSQRQIDYDNDDEIVPMSQKGGPWESAEIRPKSKKKQKIDPTEKIPGFVIETELTPELFKSLSTNKVVLLLLRIQNIPAYAVVEKIRVNLETPGESGSLRMNIDRVKPILELLKTQLTESAFYETFIVGNSEEFFESEGTQLDNLVALVGVLRKENESDNELRIRVKSYLKIRIAETTNVDDDELKALIRKSEEVAEIETLMNEAKNKKKDEK